MICMLIMPSRPHWHAHSRSHKIAYSGVLDVITDKLVVNTLLLLWIAMMSQSLLRY